jgi:hypothetical protein
MTNDTATDSFFNQSAFVIIDKHRWDRHKFAGEGSQAWGFDVAQEFLSSAAEFNEYRLLLMQSEILISLYKYAL